MYMGEINMGERKIEVLDLQNEYEEFQGLLSIAFVRREKEEYDWYYDNNPYNPPSERNMMYIMKDCEGDKKTMIAADGLTPFELYVNGQVLKCAHSVRTITHSDYRKQGLFKTMTENSIDCAKKHGLDIILGFANKNSYPGYAKFGWETVLVKDLFVLPFNVKNRLQDKVKIGIVASAANSLYRAYYKTMVVRKHKSRRIKEATITQYDQVPESVNEIWDKYKDLYKVLLVRDYKYLNYRYNAMPTENYTTLMASVNGENIGYAILRGTKTKQILELFTDPNNESYIATLLDAAIEFCSDDQTEFIHMMTGHYGKFRKVLDEFKFMTNIKSHRRHYRTMIVLPLTDKVDEELVKGVENWQITMGDGESTF